jgi:predicted nucleic acid-binding protein
MTTSELALLDTNILVYAADETSAFHVPAKQLRDQGVQGDISVAVSPQILFEFFAVITNPRRVTQPRSPQEAREEMEKYLPATTIRKIYPGEDTMRNRVQHQNKFLREWQVLKARHEQRESKDLWCTREGAKAVIDDLTEEEFAVLTAILGHLFLLNERLPKEPDVRRPERRIAEFLIGKTITGVGWTGGAGDGERAPYLSFSDGAYFECLNLVSIPDAICYDWGTADNLTEQDAEESNPL